MLAVWRRARQLGFLGPGPVEEHLEHARTFRDAVPAPDRAVDLGSGGGIPGLALALWWPASTWLLVDAGDRRTAFLDDAIEMLDISDRVTVLRSTAEDAGRDARWRGRFSLVVARSFGRPAVVAECGAPFLSEGGHLVISEPPVADAARWPADDVGRLGLEDLGVHGADLGGVRVLRQARLAPSTAPRRAGVPPRRPLW